MNQRESREVVILASARTPIGKFDGLLANVPATELGGTAIRAAVERAGVDPADVDEVLLGQGLQGGAGRSPAGHARTLGDPMGPPTLLLPRASTVTGTGGSPVEALSSVSPSLIARRPGLPLKVPLKANALRSSGR